MIFRACMYVVIFVKLSFSFPFLCCYCLLVVVCMLSFIMNPECDLVHRIFRERKYKVTTISMYRSSFSIKY